MKKLFKKWRVCAIRNLSAGMLAGILALALAPASQAQTNLYLRISGISGESTGTNHVGDLDATAFSFCVTNPAASAISTGGAATGTAGFSALSVTRFVDKASPSLVLDAAQSTHISSVILYVQSTAGSAPLDFYKVTLTGVMVGGISTSGLVNGRITETLNLFYSSLTIEYIPRNPDGTQGPVVRAGWQLAANKAS